MLRRRLNLPLRAVREEIRPEGKESPPSINPGRGRRADRSGNAAAENNLMTPKISILTPSLNQGEFIEECIKSVLDQGYPDHEHIIIDGGSTDNTIETIQKYPQIKLISESGGIYQALNRGIAQASGKIFGWINCDDIYARNVFSEVSGYFTEDVDLDAVSGGATIFSAGTGGPSRTVKTLLRPELIELSFKNITLGTAIINARFFRKEVFQRIGFFEVRDRLSADREFLLRLALAGVKEKLAGRIFYHYRSHSRSLTISNTGKLPERASQENLEIAERYLVKRDLPEEAARYLLRWHSRETFYLAAKKMKRNNLRGAAKDAARGWRKNYRWPLLAAFESLAIAKNKIFGQFDKKRRN